MPLTNAEKQRRYRQRLKEKGSYEEVKEKDRRRHSLRKAQAKSQGKWHEFDHHLLKMDQYGRYESSGQPEEVSDHSLHWRQVKEEAEECEIQQSQGSAVSLGLEMSQVLPSPVPVKEESEECSLLPVDEEEVASITVKKEENEDWLKSEDEDVVKVSVPWEPLETPSSSCSDTEDSEMESDNVRHMDTKTLSRKRPRTAEAILPQDPLESEVEDLSDSEDDDLEYIPKPGDLEDESPSKLTKGDASPHPKTAEYPKRKKRKSRNVIILVPTDTHNHNLDTVVSPCNSSSFKTQPRHPLWKKANIDSFQVPDPVFVAPQCVQSPYQYFKMFFTDQMIAHIAEQTNLYSVQQTGSAINTNSGEIEDFLSMLLYMGVFDFPTFVDYWHSDSRFPPVADAMSLRRFQSLRRYLHFNDNMQSNHSPDRFYKIRPLFNMLRQQCLLIQPTNRQNIAEVMVAYKGTKAGNLRHYKSNQHDKFGFRLFSRGSSSGIIHDLLLYQGDTTFLNTGLDEDEQNPLLGTKVVTTLCTTIAEPEATVVFCDNYLISFDLVKSLQARLGVRCIGTVRANCTGGATAMDDKELAKLGRGAYDYCSQEGVIAVRWLDKKSVSILSNACGIEPLGSVRRFCRETHQKIDITCPSVMSAYIQAKEGIDLSDMLVRLYKTPMKAHRWYHPLFGYILDLCIANGWLMYKRDCDLLNEKPVHLKRFRLSVAGTLKVVNKLPARIGQQSVLPNPHTTPKRRHNPRALQPTADVRYDCLGHWPIFGEQRGRCNLCVKGVSRWKCSKCGDGKLFLCLNNKQQCFVCYHQK
ncbi:piggyBac transposable element-derived protein 2 isoform X2 [Coregonus clupeaformis]|uniref:piggyBac transposable element-derived protein 2 isoform X2 n=1 Tax=Coregonus clupeaformis TaxID=59861 RepID=UPI001BE03A3D|nr:piggyBac transposable element-derived protein 2 isoform X2 [Coregonus clupeaformis]